MIRILTALVASVFALLSVSCMCCTGEPEAPGLRRLPKFREIETAPAPQVEYHSSK